MARFCPMSIFVAFIVVNPLIQGRPFNCEPKHSVENLHPFLELEVREAQNISVCKYIIDAIPDPRGARIPKDLEHVRCIGSGMCQGTYCCVQTYKIIEVSYGVDNGDKETLKVYVGCVWAQVPPIPIDGIHESRLPPISD